MSVFRAATGFRDKWVSPKFDCLLAPGELESRFAGWDILHAERSDFEVAGGLNKAFATVVARKGAQAC